MNKKQIAVALLIPVAFLCLGAMNSGPSPGTWAKLETLDVSSVATVDFAALPDGYRDFKVIGSAVVPATDNVQLHTRISVSASFKSGASDYSWTDFYHNSAGSGNGGGTDTGVRLFLSAGSAAGEALSFEMVLYSPADTALRKQIIGHSAGQTSTAAYVRRTIMGSYTAATSAIDGIQFLFSSGNIESGTFTLYGRMN